MTASWPRCPQDMFALMLRLEEMLACYSQSWRVVQQGLHEAALQITKLWLSCPPSAFSIFSVLLNHFSWSQQHSGHCRMHSFVAAGS